MAGTTIRNTTYGSMCSDSSPPTSIGVGVDDVHDHRAVDGDVVLRDEVRRGRAQDDEQDRERLNGPPVREEYEKGDEEAEPREQVSRQADDVELLARNFPFCGTLQAVPKFERADIAAL